MKYLLIALLFLSGCGKSKAELQAEETARQIKIEEGNKYAKTIYGKCFKDWMGETYVIEPAKEIFVGEGSQVCDLAKTCDFEHKNACITNKRCSKYVRNDYLYSEVVSKLSKPIKCPKGMRK